LSISLSVCLLIRKFITFRIGQLGTGVALLCWHQIKSTQYSFN